VIHLEELLNVEYADSLAATETLWPRELLSELRAVHFNYARAEHDRTPRVLLLDTRPWVHPDTGNKLAFGLNLDYLNEKEIAMVKRLWSRITTPNDPRIRFKLLKLAMPSIVKKAYRSYDSNFIRSVEIGDIEPTPPDYEKPKQLFEPSDAETMPPEQAAALHKVTQLVAQKKGEPPQDPDKEPGLTRLSQDTIINIAKLLKAKQDRNREKEALPKKPEPGSELEPGPDIEPDTDDLKRSILDYEAGEGFLSRLSPIIEAMIEPKALIWDGTENYIYWHNPQKFTEYQPRLRGKVLDYANGGKLIVAYNTMEGRMVVDLADSVEEILANTGWLCADVVSVLIDENSKRIEPTPASLSIMREHEYWGLVQSLCEATQ